MKWKDSELRIDKGRPIICEIRSWEINDANDLALALNTWV